MLCKNDQKWLKINISISIAGLFSFLVLVSLRTDNNAKSYCEISKFITTFFLKSLLMNVPPKFIFGAYTKVYGKLICIFLHIRRLI